MTLPTQDMGKLRALPEPRCPSPVHGDDYGKRERMKMLAWQKPKAASATARCAAVSAKFSREQSQPTGGRIVATRSGYMVNPSLGSEIRERAAKVAE